MKIEIINDSLELKSRFTVLAKIDIKCPECKQKGLEIKYRYNGLMGNYHETSGILLSCGRWEKCKSWWNEGTESVNNPWHTWITSSHGYIDLFRGSHGTKFLRNLKIQDKKLYDTVKIIDRNIIKKIKKGEIDDHTWIPFGNKGLDCPALDSKHIDFYMENDKLLSPCDKCFKPLIFWEGVYSKDTRNRFFKMLDSFKMNYRGKFNKNVVVFYLTSDIELSDFLDYLQDKLKEYNVEGKIQWRKACKEYQNLKPHLWNNTKELRNF